MALAKEYYVRRQKQGAYHYRLRRRGSEVLMAIREFGDNPKLIFDVGTADGLMLEYLSANLNATFIGIDISLELLKANPKRSFTAIQADAMALPFGEETFDSVIATAVVEHVSDGAKFLSECQRVLKEGGLLILTTPHPFFDRIAEVIGHIEKGTHLERYGLKKLESLCLDHGFVVLKAEKFMMSPIGFPYENGIEKILKAIGLDLLLMSQIVVASKRVKVDG